MYQCVLVFPVSIVGVVGQDRVLVVFLCVGVCEADVPQPAWRGHGVKKGGRITDESVHYSVDGFASVVRC